MSYMNKKGEYIIKYANPVKEDHSHFAVGTMPQMLEYFGAKSTKEVVTNPEFVSWAKSAGANKVIFGIPNGTPGEAYVGLVCDNELKFAAFHPMYAEKKSIPFMVIGTSLLHQV